VAEVATMLRIRTNDPKIEKVIPRRAWAEFVVELGRDGVASELIGPLAVKRALGEGSEIDEFVEYQGRLRVEFESGLVAEVRDL
jgi:hypothetical protein